MADSALAIPAMIGLVVAGLIVVGHRLFFEERGLAQRRLRQHLATPQPAASVPVPGGTVLRDRRLSPIRQLDRLLTGRSLTEQIARDLARADLPLRVDEYLLLRGVLALVGFGVGFRLAGSVLIGVVLGVAGFMVPQLFVRRRQGQRLQRFNDQLVETITLMSNSLKSGYSFLQGMEAVAREMPAPTSLEFAATLQAIQVGSSIEDALVEMAQRVGSDDLDMVVTAILIHRSAGGNLSEVLDNIAQTIRDRLRILREVRTLTAQERISGYVVGALPIFMIVAISLVNRNYIDMLFTQTSGHLMLAIAATLEIVGFWLIRRIIDIEV